MGSITNLFTRNKKESRGAKNHSKRIRELCVFAMLGTLMFCSKIVMELLPNIHLLGMFVMVYTIIFRKKALIPLYIFVIITGLYAGFAPWWVPYLYIWTVLWAVTMLLPKRMPTKIAPIVYMTVCGLHGLAYGSMYSVFQAFAYGFNFKQTLAWIAAGFPWDVTHSIGNFIAGILIYPLAKALLRLEKQY